MNKNLTKLFVVICCILCTSFFYVNCAQMKEINGAEQEQLAAQPQPAPEQPAAEAAAQANPYPYFMAAGAGGSFLMLDYGKNCNCLVKCSDYLCIKPITRVPVFSVSFGQYLSPWSSFAVTGYYRGLYRLYYHSPLQTPYGQFFNTRFFDFEIITGTFDFSVFGTEVWAMHICSMPIAPFATVGIGFSQTRLYSLYTALDLNDLLAPLFVTPQLPELVNRQAVDCNIQAQYVERYSFAAHADVGLVATLSARSSVSIGYTFFYSDMKKVLNPVCLKSVKANEIYASMAISF